MALLRWEDEMKILRNAARCGGCGDVLESTNDDEFNVCSCGGVYVSGGTDEIHHGASETVTYEDLSEVEYVGLGDDQEDERGKVSGAREGEGSRGVSEDAAVEISPRR